MIYELRATGKRIRFLDVSIGNPFAKHGAIWVRTSYDAATKVASSGHHASCCNFVIDPEDEWVEVVNVVIDGDEIGPKHGPTLSPEQIETFPAL
jgi:hypothetical protein